MVLIKSISGIRGTIGGEVGKSLSPLDIVKFTYAFAKFIYSKSKNKRSIVVGRDARISGKMVSDLVTGTLISCGLDVIDIGLTTTPTVEVAVELSNSLGGIVITASHNPKNWNALKLLNHRGEFLSSDDGDRVLKIAEKGNFEFANVDSIGSYFFDDSYNEKHINEVLDLDLVNVDLIRRSNLKVVVDAVNSSGGILVPDLLNRLGVQCIQMYCDPNGEFPHDPEPLPENLFEISDRVIQEKAHCGFAVDPDVDRLSIICEDGSFFGEEYTLVAVSDYVLSKTPGNTVSNLSSTRALRDITYSYGFCYNASSVGEVNVVDLMKKTDSVIGGEGNGGVIYPEFHYGRDALVGIALFLSKLCEYKKSVTSLKKSYPNYFMSKNKINIPYDYPLNDIFSALKEKYSEAEFIEIDGLKIEFHEGWVHLRKSNTEPVVRIYTESVSQKQAAKLAKDVQLYIKEIIK